MSPRLRTFLTFSGFLLCLALAAGLSPLAGTGHLEDGSWENWWNHRIHSGLLSSGGLMLDMRLTRTVMAVLAGGGLALTGAAFQATLRNPLVEPSTLGVSSAAAVGAFLATLMEWELPGNSAVQAAAFVAALTDILLIYILARLSGRLSMTSLLLSGITLSYMAGAAILLMIHLSDPYKIQTYDVWLLGSLETVTWPRVLSCLILLVPGAAVLLWQAHALNPIALGDDFARGRGVNVERVQALIFLSGSLVTAGIVSVVGPIAFVGLLVPHFVRRLVGAEQRMVLVGSLLCGAGFLTTCDILVRLISYWDLPERLFHVHGIQTLPVGVLTALIGGPVFLYVLIRTQRGSDQLSA